jgi:hypothetical protein
MHEAGFLRFVSDETSKDTNPADDEIDDPT